MALNDLLPERMKLSPNEMLQAIEILKHQIAANDKSNIVDGAVYEVWSPTITPETARILQEVLREDTKKHGRFLLPGRDTIGRCPAENRW